MKFLTYILFLFSILISFAQEFSPVLNYTPAEYGGDNQNWMISQSNKNYIYVANNKGLLEYNGASWKLYPTPNETILRSVSAVNNKIYTGCYMDFGHWEHDDTGVLKYTSLAETLNVEMIVDEQIWNIIDYEEWILFQSLNRIYIYHKTDETITTIDASDRLNKLFRVENSFYFQVANQGLYTIENRSSKLISDDPVLQNKLLVNIFKKEGEYIFLTEGDGFYKMRNAVVEPWPVEADSILKNLTVYTSITLKNKNMVLGTIANGIIELNEEGEFLYQMDQSNGLSDNTTLALFEDLQTNLWLGMDYGINCVDKEAAFKNYFDRNGKLGTVYVSAIHKNYLYLGTNQGLFYKSYGSNEEFTLVPGTKGQVWNLKVIYGDLFCGHNLGSFMIDNGEAKLITNIQGAWDFKKIPGKENHLLQGNFTGLNILVKENGDWILKNKIEGFDISSKYYQITADRKILVSHEYKGVYKLDVDEAFTTVTDFSKMSSVDKGSHSSLVSYNDNIYYANREGIFIYNDGTGEFDKEESISKIYENDQYVTGKLITDNTGKLWAFTKDALVYIYVEKLNKTHKINTIPIPISQRSALEGYENIDHLKDELYLIGTSSGYLLVNLATKNDRDHNVTINLVTIGSRTGESRLVSSAQSGEFLSKENYITFEYNTPEYHKFHVTEYQHQLSGFYDEWSPWSTSSNTSFENLPFGSYEFKVRSRIRDEESTNTAIYDFKIQRPWFLSNLAIALYILGTILLFVAINTFYKVYYRKQRERLLEKKTRELQLKELAAQKEIIQLRNQHLNQDIESRNRELAVSTMSMIKKNSILNDIKTELETLTDVNRVTNVIKVINRNLNTDEDWKFFEEAFNHADKGFFKKVKELHPELTSNDLRLCVYLRLNLSSKEIAPLLNISPRSVEIKRYRLRKKIQLPREKNLNEYFISL